MPKTGFPPTTPNTVGLPGLTAMPWNRISPLRPITSRMRSRSPTELPPEKTSTSHARQRSIAASRSAIVSGEVWNGTATPPCSVMIVLSVNLLMS